MLVVRIAGFLGMGLLLTSPIAACGGGVPDETQNAQGAATGVNPGGTASGAAADGGAHTTPTTITPPSATARDGGANADPTKPVPKVDPAGGDDDDDDNGQAGAPGRIASDQNCCFNGTYLRCPDANACMGGFDVNTCIDGCGQNIDCIEKCASNLDNSGPPVGCDGNAPAPAGVDCANGTIND